MSHFLAYLSLPDIVGIILLAGVLIIIGVVILIITGTEAQLSKRSIFTIFHKIRGYYIFGLIIFFVAFFFISLQLLPYQFSNRKTDEVVTVVGSQWDWAMGHGVTNKSPREFVGKNDISLPVDKKIKFIVTSADVTHNFALYTSEGELLTQVQAIPHYTTELQYVFKQKGKYTILCLDYCGLAHPFMTATIHIQ